VTLFQENQVRWIDDNLIQHEIPFVVIGGFAVKFYYYARETSDVDLFVGADDATITRLVAGIRQLSADPSAKDRLLDRNLGHFNVGPPYNIDVLTFVDCLDIDEAVRTAECREMNGVKIPFVSRRLLIANKRVCGTPKDLEDVRLLQE